MDYTADALVALVKERAVLPASVPSGTSATIIQYLSDTLQDKVAPAVARLQGGFLRAQKLIPIVAGQDTYDVPERALGSTFDCAIVSADGDPVERYREFGQIAAVDLPSTVGSAFYVEDDQIIIYPMPTASDWRMQIHYPRCPNALVAQTSAARVLSADVVTGELNLSSVPSEIVVGAEVDIIKGTPNFRSRGDDLVVTAIAGTVVTVASCPSDVSAGDWVSLAGTSPVPQIPRDARSFLVQGAVVRLLVGLTQLEAAQGQIAIYNELEKALGDMLSPRVKATPRKIGGRQGGWLP